MAKKRTKLLGIILFAVLALVLVIHFALVFLNKPAKGTVMNPTSSRQPAKSSFNLTPVAINGEYASFTYPAGLSIGTNYKLIDPVIAMYNFSYQDIESWDLAISILSIPSANLSDNNAYQFRLLNPASYLESQININGISVIIMSDKNTAGFSKVAFLVNGGYQATISLTGDDPNGTGNLQETFMQILNSWQWHTD